MRSAICGTVLVLATLAVSMLDGHSLRAGNETGEIRGRVLAAQTNLPVPYANVVIVGTTLGAMTQADGTFVIKNVPVGTYTVRVMMMGFASQQKKDVVVAAGGTATLEFVLHAQGVASLHEITVHDVLDAVKLRAGTPSSVDDARLRGGRTSPQAILRNQETESWRYRPPTDREQYEMADESRFLAVVDNPLSTFSIDVDRASYGNMRRFIRGGTMPPVGAIRIEELVNYFEYEYPAPDGREPFAIHTEVAGCPWNQAHRLVRIALQGKRIAPEKMPPSNLVFLIDVSGSMQPADKLPLIKSALPLLVMQLRSVDRVAIVVYAGSAGMVLDSTPGDHKRKILDAIEGLGAGGSTAGAEGIVGAYEIAQRNFIKKGNNRVILATDGDFNVGVTDDAALVRLIEEKRKSGVFLTVLGVGEGNLQDAKMEKLADHGNGNYAYLDDLLEAQKVLVSEMGGTLFTIAKDVKIQVEFNPARVESYRLIGYENRVLTREDFADDKKDAGELGSGHTVTAFYEIAPARGARAADGSGLAYLDVGIKPDAFRRDEIMTVHLRFKEPDGDKSRLVERTARDAGAAFDAATTDFRFAAAVAELGMILRDSEFKGAANLDHVVATAQSARGRDANGYRAEFIELAQACKALAPAIARDE